MKVEQLTNGQYVVTDGNLQLIQTKAHGRVYNECSIIHENYEELRPQHEMQFQPLFIALHNFKHQTHV
jgi:hypothetical protein